MGRRFFSALGGRTARYGQLCDARFAGAKNDDQGSVSDSGVSGGIAVDERPQHPFVRAFGIAARFGVEVVNASDGIDGYHLGI
jgi:hypothetical protein